TGVVPRTTDGVANDQTVGQRTVIVRAMRADGKQLVALPNEDRIVLADAAGEGAAVGHALKGNAALEVRHCRSRLVGHRSPLCRSYRGRRARASLTEKSGTRQIPLPHVMSTMASTKRTIASSLDAGVRPRCSCSRRPAPGRPARSISSAIPTTSSTTRRGSSCRSAAAKDYRDRLYL